MELLNLPPFQYRMQKQNGKHYIFDVFRKKYVLVTPEEWVRQHMLHWLVSEKGYPAGLIAVETSLMYGKLKKRADAVVFSHAGSPVMLIECKAPSVKITQAAFDQIARYNRAFTVKFLAVTNGITHYCCRYADDESSWIFYDVFPSYTDLHSQTSSYNGKKSEKII